MASRNTGRLRFGKRVLVRAVVGAVVAILVASLAFATTSFTDCAGGAPRATGCLDFIPGGVIAKGPGHALRTDHGTALAEHEGQVAVLLVKEQLAQSGVRSDSVSVPTSTLPTAYFDELSGVWQEVLETVYVAYHSSFTLQDTIWHDPATGQIVALSISFVSLSGPNESISITQVRHPGGSIRSWRIEPPKKALEWVSKCSPPEARTVCIELEYWDGRPAWVVARHEKTRHDYYFDAELGTLVFHHEYPETKLPEYAFLETLSTAAVLSEAGESFITVRNSGSGKAFVVPIDERPSWRDLSFLAAIPAAARANNGKPVVLTSHVGGGDDPAVAQFLSLYGPMHTYRLEQGTLVGSNEFEVAGSLSHSFWSSSDVVVLVRSADYHNALAASALASRLSSPLLYMTANTVPAITSGAISSLAANRAIVVGDCSVTVRNQLGALGLSVTNLLDARDVAAYLSAAGIPIEYVAVANSVDREASRLVPRLSLLAPVLAAYHDGAVYPISYQTEWKLHFNSSATTAIRPNGAPQGSAAFTPYQFTSTSPARSAGATWELHGVNGNFGWGGLPWLDGFGGGRPFYLAAQNAGTAAYDRVLIDLNLDDAIEDREVFAEGDQFFVASRIYRVSNIGGDGLWYRQGGSLTLELHTWQVGSLYAGGLRRGFVATSTGFLVDGIGAYDTVNVDLDDNGRYGDLGEGPFHSGDVITIGAKRYAISMLFCDQCWKTAGHLKLTYPSYDELNADLQGFYAAAQINPEFLALVGYHDAIPFGITHAQPYADVEDIVTDKFYGDIDADPFVDVSVGRVVAETVHNASALVARSVTYDDLLNGSWEVDSVIVTGGEGEHAAIANTLRHHLMNIGLTNTNLSSGWNDAYLDAKSVFFHFNHGNPEGCEAGPSYAMRQTMNPLIAMSGGCMTAGLDLTSPGHSVALQFLDLGALAYLGNTRQASNPIFTYEGVFWDGMAYRDLTVGEAHRRALNMWVVEGMQRGRIDHIPFHEATLYGDPAVRWHRPDNPQCVAADSASSVVSHDRIEVTYYGPCTWWSDTIRCTDGAKQMYSGPGTFFKHFFDDLLFLAESDVPGQVTGVTQITALEPPLGWAGDYCVDQHSDDGSTVLWLVKPITYDRTSGNITGEARTIKYSIRLEPSPSRTPSVTPSATETLTPTPSETPTRTRTPSGQRVYLPVVLRSHTSCHGPTHTATLTLTPTMTCTPTLTPTLRPTATTTVKKVLFDEAHSVWTSIEGNYREFADRLRGQGYVVDRLTVAPVTAQSLRDYDVYVIGTAWGDFSQAEVDAIQQFVQAGGGLFLTGLGWSWINPDLGRTLDNYPMNVIGSRFGIRFLDGSVWDPTDHYGASSSTPIFHQFAGHPVTQGLNQVGGPICPAPLTATQAGAVHIVYGDGDAYSSGGEYPAGTHPPIAVAVTSGLGRVVALGHEAYLSTDDYSDSGNPHITLFDNARLGANIINWLAGL